MIKNYKKFLESLQNNDNPFKKSLVKQKVFRGFADKFDPTKKGDEHFTGDKKEEGTTIFFSFDKAFSKSQYASQGSGTVVDAFLNIKNPFEYTNTQNVKDVFDVAEKEGVFKENGKLRMGRDTAELQISQGNYGVIETLIPIIKKLGFDSAKMNELGSENIVVFDPKQVSYEGSETKSPTQETVSEKNEFDQSSAEEIEFPHKQLQDLLEDDRDIAQVGDTVLAQFYPSGTFKLTNLQDSGRDGLGVSDDKHGIWYGINDAHFVVLWDNYMDEKDAFLPTRTPDRDE